MNSLTLSYLKGKKEERKLKRNTQNLKKKDFEQFYRCLDNFRQFSTVKFRQVWTSSDKFEQFQTTLQTDSDSFRQVCTS